MKVAGQAVLHAPVEQVWDALLDPAVLVQTIPGCDRLEATGEHEYAMTVTAGVASIRGTYAGTCALRDLVPHKSLTMKAEGAGSSGTVAAEVDVTFGDLGDGTTEVGYAADAAVGGMVGGVGQRMLTSVSKRMAGEFFGSVEDVIQAGGPAAVAATPGVEAAAAPTTGTLTGGQVYTAPAKAGAESAFLSRDGVKGAALGGALVLLGVMVGGFVGRRRH